MKFGSLFSGIGGFDLGFERAGMEGVWQCEIDKHAQSVLKNHFSAEVYNDVKTIGRNAGSVDLICGGFPCQDLSIAGKRAGLAGERSGLWFEFARIIDELEPGWVVIENVPGLLSSNKGRDFAVVLQWLVKRGYGVCWRVLDAQYFGVPQRRRRVFIVASFGNGRVAEVLFEREGMSGNTPPRRETREAVAGTFTIRSGKDGGGKGYLGQASLPMTLGGQEQYLSFDLAQITSKQHGSLPSPISQPLNTLGRMSIFDRQRSDEYGEADTVSTVSARDYKSASDLIICEPRSQDGTPRFHYDGISPTLNTAKGGQRQPMVGVRRLTPLECERLQGFPDGWTEGQSDTQRYKQLGNAVAVPVIEWLGKRIMSCNLRS